MKKSEKDTYLGSRYFDCDKCERKDVPEVSLTNMGKGVGRYCLNCIIDYIEAERLKLNLKENDEKD